MKEIKPVSAAENIEAMVLRVFLKTIDLVGGPRTLAERRHLTWANSLMSSSYIVVLREEALKSVEEIASFLGLTTVTVQNVLRADPDLALKKVRQAEEGEDIRVHVAGGLARKAYQLVRQGLEEPRVLQYFLESFVELVGAPWAWAVLQAVRGVEFPIEDAAALLERMRGLTLQERPAEELLERLDYPIATPVELLRQLKHQLEEGRTL